MATKKTAKVQPRAAEIAAVDALQVVGKVASLKKNDLAGEFAAIGNGLADLASRVDGGLATFDEVNAAIRAREARLRELHEVDDELLRLADARGQREAEEALLEAEKAEREIERAREDNEYHYNLTRKRRDEQDRYNDQLAATKKRDAQVLEEAKSEIAARYDALADREAAVEALEATVAAFPAELDAAVKKAEAILGNTLKRQYEHERQLAEKDSQAKSQLAAQEVANLKAQLAASQGVVAGLNASLAAANEKVTQIAAQAVAAASGRQALEALQSHTATQASAPSKNGR